jgi:hypothetical protein
MSSTSLFDNFVKTSRRLFKVIEQTKRRHRDEKSEGPKATGKVALKGPKLRWNDYFYTPFLVGK